MGIKVNNITGNDGLNQIEKVKSSVAPRQDALKRSKELPHDRMNQMAKPVLEPPIQNRAVFAIDENRNVTIQIIDKDGKVLKQIPPEEYINMVRKLKQVTEGHFDEWV